MPIHIMCCFISGFGVGNIYFRVAKVNNREVYLTNISKNTKKAELGVTFSIYPYNAEIYIFV